MNIVLLITYLGGAIQIPLPNMQSCMWFSSHIHTNDESVVVRCVDKKQFPGVPGTEADI